MYHLDLLTGDDQPFTRPVTFTRIKCPYCRANTHRIQQMGVAPNAGLTLQTQGIPMHPGIQSRHCPGPLRPGRRPHRHFHRRDRLTTYQPRHQITLYEPDQDDEWWKAESISWDPHKTVRTFYVPEKVGQSLLDELHQHRRHGKRRRRRR